MSTMSVREARENFAYVVDAVYTSKKPTIVTRFGKPKVKIVPIDYTEDEGNSSASKKLKVLKKAKGLWEDRKLSDFKRENTRYGKIFS